MRSEAEYCTKRESNKRTPAAAPAPAPWLRPRRGGPRRRRRTPRRCYLGGCPSRTRPRTAPPAARAAGRPAQWKSGPRTRPARRGPRRRRSPLRGSGLCSPRSGARPVAGPAPTARSRLARLAQTRKWAPPVAWSAARSARGRRRLRGGGAALRGGGAGAGAGAGQRAGWSTCGTNAGGAATAWKMREKACKRRPRHGARTSVGVACTGGIQEHFNVPRQ